jgi:hypothetical protein
MAAADFTACSGPPGYVMLNSLKDSRMVPAATAILATRSCCVSTGALPVPPEKEIQWSQVRGERGPGYWTSMSNPSVPKGFIQILTDDISALCRGAIMLAPIPWPLRSPDLTPLDFFLWGTCKAWCTRLQWRHNMILWQELQ